MASFDYPVSGGQSPYWGSSVGSSGSLPASGTTGEVIFVRDTTDFYHWNGSAWAKVTWSLTADVTGVLPVANGGTNSSTALVNNRVMISSTGAIVESSTTATELSYLNNVTSDIQTQLDDEASARSSADTTLQNNIDTEESARQSADTTLQGNIDSEETRALAAEAVLQGLIDDLEAADVVLDSRLDTAETDIAALEAADTALDGRLDTAEADIVALEAADVTLQSNIDAKQNDVITSQGDLVVGNGSGDPARLAIGASGTVLQSNGTTASWGTPAAGAYSAKSADYTVLDNDGIAELGVTAASDVTITLPTAADNANRVLTVKKVDSGSGKVIVDGESAETIDGETTYSLYVQYDAITLLCTGSAWLIVNKNLVINGRHRFETMTNFSSNNTWIPYYGSQTVTEGSSITSTNSSTNGYSATINQPGFYKVKRQAWRTGGTGYASITKNVNSGLSAALANFRSYEAISAAAAGVPAQLNCVVKCAVGDVIRPHAAANEDTAQADSFFEIEQIARF
jgi:hypothetical protein